MIETLFQNGRGNWVPAIPIPVTRVRHECSCGERFWTMDGYNGHYAYVHLILEIPSS